MLRLAELIETERDYLAQVESHDVGKPIREAALVDLPACWDPWRFFAGAVRDRGRPRPRPAAHLARLRPPRADRRRRDDHPVELPAPHRLPQGLGGARRRKHGRPEGAGAGSAHEPRARPPGARGRHPAGRLQRRPRARRGGRGRARRAPRREQDRLHRLDHDRPRRDARRSRDDQARLARAGREVAVDRVRRRRPRPGRDRLGVRDLPGAGRGVLGGLARPGRAARPRRVRGPVRRAGPPHPGRPAAQMGDAARRTDQPAPVRARLRVRRHRHLRGSHGRHRRRPPRRPRARRGQLHPADGVRRRAERHADRAGGDLRPGRRHHPVRRRGGGDPARQRRPLRPRGGHLDGRRRPRPPRRPRARRRLDLGEPLRRVSVGGPVRRLQGERHRPRPRVGVARRVHRGRRTCT